MLVTTALPSINRAQESPNGLLGSMAMRFGRIVAYSKRGQFGSYLAARTTKGRNDIGHYR
jgi:hypothetical protein